MKLTISNTKRFIARFTSSKLSRNIGWLTTAELVSRVGRIFAAIILARQLDATAFGIAAIALTVFELIRVFTENGIGAAVIRASSEQFHKVANTANRLMWHICLSLAVLQITIGYVVELISPGKELGLMIASLSVVYMIMPFGLVHAYCLLRQERMKHLAVVSSGQAIADHLLTTVLAILGFGAWAIVLPKVLTAPIWLFGVRFSKPWQRTESGGFADHAEIYKFSLPVLGAELVSACRDQLDKVIVSLTLGVEAIGIYYFAYNAGLGVSTALNRAFSNAIYPHLCSALDAFEAYKKSLMNLAIPLCSAYVLQSLAALVYVPLVFGEKWSHVSVLVAVLCLGGPARLLMDGWRMMQRSAGRTGIELLGMVGFCTSVLLPFLIMSSKGLLVAAIASALTASFFSILTTATFLRNKFPARSIVT